ncbi:hypothetical protein [uncultured Lacinutrix sp.]|uniref:tetratricopeptide repeat protein n=1 Tax=uncultured Lacinutrix sp. TaxID=574032 RepID=UPI002610DBB6|nr:hypothetical protein [uncultured Lacinutrix sp.]
MSLEEDILIERFLRNELSEEERENFLKRINNDETFREMYNLEKQISEGLNQKDWNFVANENTKELEEYDNLFKDEQTQKLKNEIKKVLLKRKEKNSKRVLMLFTGAAAIVLLLLVINFFVSNTSLSTNELYAEYIHKEELVSFRSRGEDALEKELVVAEKEFKKKEYRKALNLFNKSLEKEKDYSSLYIYKAVSHIELKEYNEAEIILNELINTNLIDAEKGFWYKSLLYVKANKLSEAKSVLNKIIQESYFKKEQAKELLDKIEELKYN